MHDARTEPWAYVTAGLAADRAGVAPAALKGHCYISAVDQERFGPIDFDRFHQEELPALLRGRGPVFSGADAAVVRPLGFQLPDGRAYTYVPEGRTFSVRPGTAAAQTVVELSRDSWCAFAWELKTCFALLYADQLTVRTGSFGQVARWEPPLRVAFSDQVLFDLDQPARMEDGAGHDIDLTKSFTLEDPVTETREFLHRVGFVHLRGVLDADEIEALTSDVHDGIRRARPDDRKSWWTTVDGREVCNRVNYLNDGSPRIAALGADPRFLDIAALGGADLRDAHDRLDGNSVVIKVPGSDGGLADLPWHRDCGMGGHPVKCPMLNMGIQLDAATAATGQLRMIPGSHRGTSRLPNRGRPRPTPSWPSPPSRATSPCTSATPCTRRRRRTTRTPRAGGRSTSPSCPR